ncbi:MAG: alpha/beta fold hydrolase, partial [Planctomycetaceae bacterium]
MSALSRKRRFEDETFAGEYPFAPHFLDLDGLRYHYVDEGRGEPLLMVHGNPTWSFAWRKLIKDLSRDHRVLAVDHIGCGRSDKPQESPYRLSQHVD